MEELHMLGSGGAYLQQGLGGVDSGKGGYYIYIYTYIHTYIHTYIYIYIHMFIHSMCISVYLSLFVVVYICHPLW